MGIWYDGGSFSWVPPYCSLIKKGGGGQLNFSVLFSGMFLTWCLSERLLDSFQALFPTGIALLNHIN